MKIKLLTFLGIFWSISSIAQVADQITVINDQTTNETPSSFSREVRFKFKYNSSIGLPAGTGSYSGLMSIAPWSDDSGGPNHQINFNQQGLYWRQGLRSSGWGGWKKILTDDGNGNVGIGTTSPLSKLTIGNITGTITSTTGISLGADQNSIEFLNSNYSNGYGAKLYGVDQGNGMTSFRLAVRGNSTTWTDALFVRAGDNGAGGGNLGYIGIGSTNPDARLTVSDASSDLSILKLKNSAWVCNQRTSIEFWNGANKNYPTSRIASQMDGCSADGEALSFETQTTGQTTLTSKLFIKNNGNVGIGTTSPQEKLHVVGNAAVKGQVHANEVKVDLNVPGPDYVFEKEYKLTSLEDIKTYIDQNKHLPEIPSAKEMEKNGVQLGEMNMLLLKKIEELTLHVIEQQAKMEAMQKEINQLKTK